MNVKSATLRHVLVPALLSVGAAGAGAQARDVPGASLYCPQGAYGVIPPTRGMTPQQAIDALGKAGFRNVGRLRRPTDGMRAGRVMGSNPHVDVRVCVGTRVTVYEVESPPRGGTLRNFSGDTAGWQIAPATDLIQVSCPSASAGPVVLAALADKHVCSVKLVTHDGSIANPPPPLAPSIASAPTAGTPEEPASPALPLTGGALGGALLARMLWGRDREAKAASGTVPPDAADMSPRLRVRRDDV